MKIFLSTLFRFFVTLFVGVIFSLIVNYPITWPIVIIWFLISFIFAAIEEVGT